MIRLAHILGIVAALLLAVPAHADETLTYDANGNIQSRTLPGGTTQYGYDDLDRLTSETGPAKTQSLTYDANDNRLSDGSGNKTYTANTNQLATANGQTVTRDKAGNITQIRDLSLEWNQAGQLRSVSRQSAVVSSQGVTSSIMLLASYYYDYKGRRSRKVTPTETTIYIYDLWDHLLGEFNGSGNPLRTYIWRDDIPVAVIQHGTPEKVLYLETDHLNTPIAASDENAKVVWKWESDAFGSTPPNEDPDKDGVKTTINLRFPGQFYDKESGFHYNHHRYYDPQTGRYLSSDLIGLAGGRNGFGYVGGNPLGYIDPLGLMTCQWVGPVWVCRSDPPPSVTPPFDEPSKPGVKWPSISWPSWLTPKSALDRCEAACDDDYDNDQKLCETWWKTTGRNADAYRVCMARARDRNIKCYQDCKKDCQ